MLVTIDFETYYDSDYTLRKMSTSEYIRHKSFEAISCSIKIGKRKPFCYFGKEDIAKAFAKIEWSETILLAHHNHFDGLILSHHFGHVPKRYACTLSMARVLHPKSERNDLASVAVHYNVANKLEMPDFKGKHLKDIQKNERRAVATYNNGDVESCYQAYNKMLPDVPTDEMELIDVTVRMFADPVLRVDLKKAKEELKREQTTKAAAILNSDKDIDTLSSGPKFVASLSELGIDVPTKDSPSVRNEDGTPKQIPAIAKSDESLQSLLLHPDKRVADLVAGRLAAKSTIGESRAARMIMSGSGGLRLPIYLNYAMAHTLRWSGGDKFNPQNLKQSQKVGGVLRECILAPKGDELVVVDSSQIEARIVAWLAGQEDVLEAFRALRDIYSEFATGAYGRVITKSDKEERFVGKTCILGLGFGMGGVKLQATLLTQSVNQGLDPVRLPLASCYDLVSTYRKTYTNIVKLWKTANNDFIGAMLSGRRHKFKCLQFDKDRCWLPNGLPLQYPELEANIVKTGSGFFKGDFAETVQDASYLAARARSKVYGGLLVENIVQALARIVVADAMREISRVYRVVMMTHDEVVFVAKRREAEKAFDWAVKIMSTPPVWAPDLPLNAEGGHDVCYSK